MATAVLDGRPVAVTGGGSGVILVWDLYTGAVLGRLAGHGGAVQAIAVTVVDGRPMAVSGADDGTVRIWDLLDRVPRGGPLPGHVREARAVAIAVVDGRPVVLVGHEDCVARMRDVRTGERLDRPLRGHTGWVRALATAAPGGRPVAVSAGRDATVRAWDLGTSEQLGRAFGTGAAVGLGAGWVGPLAIAEAGGRPVVGGGVPNECTLRTWDLYTGEQRGTAPVFPQPVSALAWEPGAGLVVGFGWELAVLKPCPWISDSDH
ncbi:hypothetical protein ACGFY6_30150 [Streptomyces sp. NPDC048387]|uniref:hypothetical protein n=1 Tax=Streptomyces sp. NPDC048387 TaxID=3365542 RepID=UPI003712EC19